MLDKEHKSVDAVSVSTPDHTHAVAAMAAIQRGKHVYVQKPLTHSIQEARMLTEAAKTIQSCNADGQPIRLCRPCAPGQRNRQCRTYRRSNRVYTWTNRPVWPQGIPAPTGKHEIPKELDWDLWLGPAPSIDYNPAYLPFNWRGWWNFGTGALGDMACHIMDAAFRILPIDYPTEVECSATTAWSGFFEQANYKESCPSSSIIHLKFPRKTARVISVYLAGWRPASSATSGIVT